MSNIAYQITGHHVEITQALKNKATICLDKATKNCQDVTSARLVLSVEKHTHKVEATIHVKGQTLHAEHHADSMYAAIDLLEEKLTKQLAKHNAKVHDHHQSEGRVTDGLDVDEA